MNPRPCASLSANVLATGSVRAAERPNVLFVITDDQGYGDLSCLGNPVLQTPNLDRLYRESARLTDFHVSPTCAPTRGALMSGHYTNRAGSWHTIMGRSLLFEGEKTFGEVFSDNGYVTGMFGKWHLGDNYPFRPEDRGFDEVVRHGGGGVGQTPDFWDNAYFDDTYFHNGKPVSFSGYCTDVFFREARRFIKESAVAKKPFMAYISSNAPHGPFHCPEQYWHPYRERVDDEVAVFFGMIANIDENVGALRAWLKDQGLDRNTIFVFMTDNGTATGEKVFNAGMRGRKSSEYEGGHRVPFFLHWPAGGLAQGVDVAPLTAHIDVLPTLIDLCGLETPADYTFDGRSMAPLLRNPEATWPERTVVTDSQRVRDPVKWRKCSTMTDRWRMVNGEELYDIKVDPGQASNVAARHPEVVAKLRADYETWWEELSPALQHVARIAVGHPAENPSLLTCHDWLTEGSLTPWNQAHIRQGQEGSGYWALRVTATGTYRIELMRWPQAVSRAIDADLPPGQAVPGLAAFRETPGKGLEAAAAVLKIGDGEWRQTISPGNSSASFTLDLEEGETDLQGNFVLKDSRMIGAYYASVEKLP